MPLSIEWAVAALVGFGAMGAFAQRSAADSLKRITVQLEDVQNRLAAIEYDSTVVKRHALECVDGTLSSIEENTRSLVGQRF